MCVPLAEISGVAAACMRGHGGSVCECERARCGFRSMVRGSDGKRAMRERGKASALSSSPVSASASTRGKRERERAAAAGARPAALAAVPLKARSPSPLPRLVPFFFTHGHHSPRCAPTSPLAFDCSIGAGTQRGRPAAGALPLSHREREREGAARQDRGARRAPLLPRRDLIPSRPLQWLVLGVISALVGRSSALRLREQERGKERMEREERERGESNSLPPLPPPPRALAPARRPLRPRRASGRPQTGCCSLVGRSGRAGTHRGPEPSAPPSSSPKERRGAKIGGRALSLPHPIDRSIAAARAAAAPASSSRARANRA